VKESPPDRSEQVLGITRDVVAEIFSSWITVRDLIKLESACCSAKSKSFFDERILGLLLTRKVHGAVARRGVLDWLLKRQIPCEALDFESGGHVASDVQRYLCLYGNAVHFLCLGQQVKIVEICRLLPNLQELTNLPEKDVSSTDTIEYIQSCCPKLQSLQLVGQKNIFMESRVGADGWRNLQELELVMVAKSNETLQAIVSTNPTLRTIAIHRSGWYLYARPAVEIIVQHCPLLEHLKLGAYHQFLYDEHLIALATHCPLLKLMDFSGRERSWTGAGLDYYIKHCGNLTSLDLNYADTMVDDSLLLAMGQHLQKLETLNIARCVLVTNEGICALAQGCSILHMLDVSYCDKVSHDGVCEVLRYCDQLRELRIIALPRLDSAAFVAAFTQCGRSLRYITTDNLLLKREPSLLSVLQRRCYRVEIKVVNVKHVLG
jgi:hypothetical protein